MTAPDEVRVIFHEESQDQHADVHPVVIGIGGHNDVVVAQVVQVVFHSEGGDQKIQLLILGDPLAALLVAVDRLSPEAEHCLVVGVPYLRDGSGSGVSLGYEYAGLFRHVLLVLGHLVAEMVPAVT